MKEENNRIMFKFYLLLPFFFREKIINSHLKYYYLKNIFTKYISKSIYLKNFLFQKQIIYLRK